MLNYNICTFIYVIFYIRLYVYIVQAGLLDGREGYYFARLHGFYEFLSVAKAHELRKKKKAASSDSR